MSQKLRLIYYDTETTGVKNDVDRIIEIAAYDPENDLTFCEFVNPGIPIPEDSTAIHGITDDMVSKAGSFQEVGTAFISFCGEGSCLVAHNNDAFDRHFIANEAKRAGLELPDFPMIDSLKWARKYRPDLPRHSLQYLRQVFCIESNQAHRALDDVIILHKVFSILIDDLDTETILRLLDGDEEFEVMPFGKHQGKPLSDVPPDYVKWLTKQGAFDKPENSSLKKAFDKVLACK